MSRKRQQVLEVLTFATLIAALLPCAAEAQWLPAGVSISSSSPWLPFPDLAGGATCGSTRVDANGYRLWSFSVSGFSDVASCSDARGGYILVGGNGDIIGSRFSASGTRPWGGSGSVTICAANLAQAGPVIAPDGSGGAVLAWLDSRNGGGNDIYAARVDSSGNVLWTFNGVPVCAASGIQSDPAIVGDGSGGAYIVWRDARPGVLGGSDLYGQHLNGAGLAQWTADGMPIAVAAGDQQAPVLETDGAGGVYAAWWDYRDGPVHIYMQRLNGVGESLLTPNGQLAVGGAIGALLPKLLADGSGGVYLTWEDHRAGGDSGSDIYLNRLNGSGVSVWGGEVPVCTESHFQTRPSIVADGFGGVIISWSDGRAPLPPGYTVLYTPYTQRLTSAGIALWAANGVPVNLETSTASPSVPLAADGTGGAFYEGYARTLFRLLADGSPAWVPNFSPPNVSAVDLPADEGGYVRLTFAAPLADVAPLVPAPAQYEVWRKIAGGSALAPGGIPAGSLLARSPVGSLTAGTVLPAGNWEVVGTAVANGASSYTLAVPTHTDSSSAGVANETYVVMTLTITRTLYTVSDPVSAHSVDNLAPPPPSLLVGGRTGSNSVQLSWQPSSASDVWHYSVYRGSDAGFPTDGAHRIAVPTSAQYADGAFVDGTYYKVTATDRHGNESPAATLAPGGITGVTPGAAPRVSYAAVVGANPFARRAVIEYGLARAGHVELAIYDVTGRKLATLVDGLQAEGVRRVTWEGATALRIEPGVYLARFAAPGVSRTLRLVSVE